MRQLLADRAISAGDILKGTVDEMQDRGAAFDMAEETGADADALACSLDQPRQVGEHEFVVVQADDAELRLQCRERVVGDLWPRMRDRGEKGRFAGVGSPTSPTSAINFSRSQTQASFPGQPGSARRGARLVELL